MCGFRPDVSEILRPVIASRLTDGGSPYVDIKTKVGWVFSRSVSWPEVPFADMDGAIARISKPTGHCEAVFIESLPIPFRRTIGAFVVCVGIDPSSCAMPGAILTGHQ